MFSKFRLSPFYFLREANANGSEGNGSGENNNQGDPETFDTFEDWYNSLSEDQKKVVGPGKAHFDTVYSTLSTVRDERDDFNQKWRDAIKQLKDSPEKQKLQEALDETERRANFYETATDNKCLNIKAAYALAKSQELFDKKGNPNWAELQKQAPELFGEKKRELPRKGNAGSGTSGRTPASSTMNDWIRKSAGREVTSE